MQHLNNDMEKFLRKAAKNAPVRPKGMNWDEVNAQLQQQHAEKGKVRKIDFKKYWFVLLFILPSLVCDKYLLTGFGSDATSHLAKEEKSLTNSFSLNDPVLYRNNKRQIYSTGKHSNINPIAIDKKVIVIHKAQIRQALTSYLVHKKIVSDYNSTTQHGYLKNIEKPVIAASSIEISNKPGATKTKDIALKKHSNRFYTSIIMAPEFSTVKLQKVQKIGYSVGLKGGYKINNKWSVETGLLWQHKNYYADGKAFNTAKMSLPQHTKILHATGYCDMFDIPLDVRYNFKTRQTANWYVLAGASTYLMQHEDYNYLCERYGQQYNYSWYNKKASQYLFSVINVGIGYEHQLGRLGKIRMEPYAKLPLKGIGMGKLPISSAGVNFGLTHPL